MNMKAEKRAYILLSLIQLVLGAYLIAQPTQSFSVICYLVGGVLIVYGVIKLIGYFTWDMYQLAYQYDFAMGVLCVVVGCLMVFRWEQLMRLFPTIIGILVLIDGVFKIQTALDARRFGLRKWWLILILAIASGVAGFALFMHPVETGNLLMQLVGLNLMIDGGLNLWVVVYTVTIVKKRSRRGRADQMDF